MPDTLRVVESEVVSSDRLKGVAQMLLNKYKTFPVWLFSGEMGAGKTTLIKAICQELGVHAAMSSPTFSIINEYQSPAGTIYHFDFYRLKKESEAFDLGVEEYLDSGHFCFIEWPGKIESLLPSRRVEINLLPKDASHRIIQHCIHD
jgi:tRNA threonylcarbamoyladenosine biosynthesis protein TsaE